MTSNIVVIGSGKIGSRHVQSLTYSNNKTNLFVVDPNKINLKKTKNLFFKNIKKKNKINIFFEKNIKKFCKIIDIAIIATNSDVRRKVIEELISLNNVKYLILEKVVFQNMDDFDAVIKLLNEKKIKSYINFPRRLATGYINLKKTIKNQKKIHMSFIGSDWGLACNSLHMLDLFAFLIDTNKIFIEEVSLQNKIFDTSRKGFIELKGTLKSISERGDTLYLSDIDSKSGKVVFEGIKIENKNFLYFINENFQKIAKIKNNKKLSTKVNSFKVPAVSIITNIIINDLLKKNKTGLTTIQDTYYHHKMILEIFLSHIQIQKGYKNISNCPIT